MRLLLIGQGKMGQAIAQVAQQRGHHLAYKIDLTNRASLTTIDPVTVDVAIEFSQPAAAYDNICQCLSKNIPVLSGTTGWLAKLAAVKAHCQAQQGTFFYASNFSIGMQLFLQANAFLAKLMHQHPAYNVALEEVHHTEKKDIPSGTAITLAEKIIQNMPCKKHWALAPTQQKDRLPITAKRVPDVPGTHTVTYTSSADTLELTHTAHSRAGFALGAVLVAEWLQGQQGVLGMEDFLAQ